MTVKEFCIEVTLTKYPNCTDAAFIANEIKEVMKEDVSELEVAKYISNKFIESEHLLKESRAIEYYSLTSKDIFNE